MESVLNFCQNGRDRALKIDTYDKPTLIREIFPGPWVGRPWSTSLGYLPTVKYRFAELKVICGQIQILRSKDGKRSKK